MLHEVRDQAGLMWCFSYFMYLQAPTLRGSQPAVNSSYSQDNLTHVFGTGQG